MEPAVIAAIITGGATLCAASLAARMIMHQLSRQARIATEQSKLNERLKLKLQAYQQVLSICSAQQEADLAASSPIRMLSSYYVPLWDAPEMWQGVTPKPNTSAPQLLELTGKAKEAAIEIVFFAERWRVIEPRLDLFQIAAHAVLHNVNAATTPLVDLSMRVLPPPPEYVLPQPWQPPKGQLLGDFKRVCDAALEALQSLDLLATDFQTEMQNVLLADLFPNRMPLRQPIDPRFAPIRLDHYEQQKRFLETETEWGKHAAEIDNAVRQQLDLALDPSPDTDRIAAAGSKFAFLSRLARKLGSSRA